MWGRNKKSCQAKKHPWKFRWLEPQNHPNEKRKITWTKPPYSGFQMFVFQGEIEDSSRGINKESTIHLRSRNYTPENKHDIGKSPCSMGNTSSNGGFSIVMLVFFGGYPLHFVNFGAVKDSRIFTFKINLHLFQERYCRWWRNHA